MSLSFHFDTLDKYILLGKKIKPICPSDTGDSANSNCSNRGWWHIWPKCGNGCTVATLLLFAKNMSSNFFISSSILSYHYCVPWAALASCCKLTHHLSMSSLLVTSSPCMHTASSAAPVTLDLVAHEHLTHFSGTSFCYST